MGISRRSLFPATIVTVLSGKFKLSKCTLGGSAENIIKKYVDVVSWCQDIKLNPVTHWLCTNDVNFGREALWISLRYKGVISCIVKGAGLNFKTMDPGKPKWCWLAFEWNWFWMNWVLSRLHTCFCVWCWCGHWVGSAVHSCTNGLERCRGKSHSAAWWVDPASPSYPAGPGTPSMVSLTVWKGCRTEEC